MEDNALDGSRMGLGMGARSSITMQRRISLGEEGSGAVVEKQMGVGHSDIHLCSTVTKRKDVLCSGLMCLVYILLHISMSDHQQTDVEAKSS